MGWLRAGETFRMDSTGRRKRLVVQRHGLGPSEFVPRGNIECGPLHDMAKSHHAIIQGRCYGVTKPDLRTSGSKGGLCVPNPLSGSLFCHLQKVQ